MGTNEHLLPSRRVILPSLPEPKKFWESCRSGIRRRARRLLYSSWPRTTRSSSAHYNIISPSSCCVLRFFATKNYLCVQEGNTENGNILQITVSLDLLSCREPHVHACGHNCCQNSPHGHAWPCRITRNTCDEYRSSSFSNRLMRIADLRTMP